MPKSTNPRHARLAQRIVEAAVAGGWPSGRHVVEEDMVRLLDVSRSPARAALRVLARHGVVEMRPGRGAVLLRPGRDMADLAIDGRVPVEDSLRLALLRDRLAGELAAAQPQTELAQRYAVGLPTLQRVLERMQGEGLVLRSGWQWSFPDTLQTRASQEASYDVRLMVEPASLLLPGFQAEARSLDAMLADHAALVAGPARPPDRIFELDARFHETLAEWGGNPFILNLVRQQNALRAALEMDSYADRARVAAWCAEHVRVLQAVRARAMNRANRLLAGHLWTARAKMLGVG